MYKLVTLSKSPANCRVSISRYKSPAELMRSFPVRNYFSVSLASQKRVARLFSAYPPNFQDITVSKDRIEIHYSYHPGYFAETKRNNYPQVKTLVKKAKKDVLPDWVVAIESGLAGRIEAMRTVGFWGEVEGGGDMLHLFVRYHDKQGMCSSACRMILTDPVRVLPSGVTRFCISCVSQEDAVKVKLAEQRARYETATA